MLLPPDRERRYPNLRAHGYTVTSEETLHNNVRYNCVAWAALGDTKKWWQAEPEPDYFWPTGILDDGSFQSYVQLNAALGYEPCQGPELEILYEKIALFADSNGDFTHVSYQLFLGWTSKLGGWQDIKHKTLTAMEGGLYGDVRMLMKRRSSLRGFLARGFFGQTSRFWPLDRERAFKHLRSAVGN
jgi:hypothetical protein